MNNTERMMAREQVMYHRERCFQHTLRAEPEYVAVLTIRLGDSTDSFR